MPPPRADVVVVAAGTASRMGGIDKILAPIAGRPLLAWTLSTFVAHPAIDRIVVVASPSRVRELRDADWIPTEAAVVSGGDRRQESVAAGVAEVERHATSQEQVILVHDGARPAVGSDLVASVIEATALHGAAIPLVPVVETLKRIDGDVVGGTVDRAGLGYAQTPQGIRLGILLRAYRRFPPDGGPTFTDEAALLEACTIPVRVVPGEVDNLKVTIASDLRRAAAVLAPAGPRVGFGEDSHPFGPGDPLALGGISIAGAPRLAGHSDGDVALHAVADALLGAAGLGDLGRSFPADDRTPRGVASSDLLADVVARVSAAGYAVTLVDLTIVAARPRLGPTLDSMRDRISELLSVGPDRVSVKASTGNLGGPEGAGRGIAARAIATLEPRR
jgi:2-C-methyl-D-erythritol 4-phosphate cytidylyltransferase / 2-C-methyl-D-erythritol 2,4-cyclodiphosphate synthase